MNRIQHFSYVRGRVVNTVGHGNVPGVTVILSLVSGRQRTQVAQTITNASGKFVIDVEAATQRGELPRAGRYEISVRKSGAEAKITGGRWRWFQGDAPGDVQLCVTLPEVCDAVPPAPPGGLVPGGGPPTVVGRVLHHDGTPAAGVVVRARDFQIDGASDTALGSTTTDSQGWYGIAFSPPGVGAPPRNLFVEVLNTDSPARMLGVSSPQFGANPPVRIDVNIWDDAYRAPSEWAQYNGPLDDARDTLSFGDLTWSAVSFLAGRTKVPVLAVCAWRDAHRLALTLDLEIDDVAEAIYGLLRIGFPPDLRVMELRGSARISSTLELALRENYIGLAASLIFEDLVAGLTEWRVSLYSDGANANSLTALFSASGLLSTEQVTDIVAHYATYTPADGPFWDTVAALDEFETDEAAVLEAQRLVTLAGLAFSHAPTVAAITTAISNGAASLTATLTPSEWTTVVGTIAQLPPGVEGESDSAQRANYVVSLRANALAAYPGTAVGFSVRADATLGDVYDFATIADNIEFDFEKDDVLEDWARDSVAHVVNKDIANGEEILGDLRFATLDESLALFNAIEALDSVSRAKFHLIF